MPARQINKRPLPKWITRALSKAEITLYDTKRNPLLAMRIQRKRPSHIIMSGAVIKKNPDKVLLAESREFGGYMQVFLYKTNAYRFFIAYRGEMIALPIEARKWLRKALLLVPDGS